MTSSGTNTVAQRPLDGVEEITLAPRTVVGLRETVAVNELSAFFTRAIPAVAAELARVGTRPAGAPVAVYRHEQGQQFDVTVGFPVDKAPDSTDALVREELPGGRAARANPHSRFWCAPSFPRSPGLSVCWPISVSWGSDGCRWSPPPGSPTPFSFTATTRPAG